MSPTAMALTEKIIPPELADDWNLKDPTNPTADQNTRTINVSTDITKKKGTVSIDVTKALLLLGISSWSNLEQGIVSTNKSFRQYLIHINKNISLELV